MAVLTEGNRALTLNEFMREASAQRDGLALTKADLRAAIDAIDSWVDTNSSAFNTAIPQPARGALTTRQKAWLLFRVVHKRFEVS